MKPLAQIAYEAFGGRDWPGLPTEQKRQWEFVAIVVAKTVRENPVI